MVDENDTSKPLQDDDKQKNADFLELANDAKGSGDSLLSMYLYLAAFQKAQKSSSSPNEDAISGLKEAWALACTNKERSLAEYIFELMEPYLTSEEISACAEQLQDLAFDKLSEIGLSRGDLEEIADAISDEFDGMNDAGVLDSSLGITIEEMIGNLLPGTSFAEVGSPHQSDKDSDVSNIKSASASIDPIDGSLRDVLAFDPEGFDYDHLAGFDKQKQMMRELGIGVSGDMNHLRLVEMLNYRHGLKTSPSCDSLLFRSSVREDANRFMVATAGELSLPSVHMRMEEGYQGSPILCIATHDIDSPNPTSLRKAFANGGTLILENLDLWEAPITAPADDGNPLFFMQMTRGAREAINLIRAAVEDPRVFVIATSSLQGTIDEFFLELLEPLTFIDIDLPDEQERLDIWMDISKNHASIRQINKSELVRYSANMSRFDIYMAAREAIEEAYKMGIAFKKYIPVSRENIFDKLACYQPLESSEYADLENEVIRDFQDDLDKLDDLLA